MSKIAVPDEVRRFILTSVPSVPYLEALLLLRGEPAHSWNASQVARRLYIGEAQAQELLDALQQSGIAGSAATAASSTRPAARSCARCSTPWP